MHFHDKEVNRSDTIGTLNDVRVEYINVGNLFRVDIVASRTQQVHRFEVSKLKIFFQNRNFLSVK